ncbi:MAG: COX15/CtaA family protein [Acidobacteriota bacterium]
MPRPWLHRYSIFLACCTLFLVVAGATVTSKEAGLSVPDWPLSYGQLMPPMYGNIFFEHGHRMIATTVGFLTIILAVWLYRADDRPWMRRLGFAALAAVIVQGILGGITVLFLLPKWVSASHACLAEIFFSTTVAIALFTSPSFRRAPQMVDGPGSLNLRTLALLLPVLVFAQVFLGAAYRHKAIDILWHVTGAVIVTAAVMFVAIFALLCYQNHRTLRDFALILLGITFIQVFLGIAAYMSRVVTDDAPQPMPVMVWFTVAHVATGALTLAASTLFAIQANRHVRPVAPASMRSAANMSH